MDFKLNITMSNKYGMVVSQLVLGKWFNCVSGSGLAGASGNNSTTTPTSRRSASVQVPLLQGDIGCFLHSISRRCEIDITKIDLMIFLDHVSKHTKIDDAVIKDKE